MNIFFSPDGQQFDYQNITRPLVEEALTFVVRSRYGFNAESPRRGDGTAIKARDFLISCKFGPSTCNQDEEGNVELPFPLTELEQRSLATMCETGYVAANDKGEHLYETGSLNALLKFYWFRNEKEKEAMTMFRMDYDDGFGKVSCIEINDLFKLAYCHYEKQMEQ